MREDMQRADMQRAEHRRESEDEALGAPATQRVSSGRFVRAAQAGAAASPSESPVSDDERDDSGAAVSSRRAMATLPDGVPASLWYAEPEGGEVAAPDSDGIPATRPSPVRLPTDGHRP